VREFFKALENITDISVLFYQKIKIILYKLRFGISQNIFSSFDRNISLFQLSILNRNGYCYSCF